MYRKIFKVESEDDLLVELPKEYLNKEIEITAFETGNQTSADGTNVTDFSDAEAFFSRFSIDMSQFKFNRDEANER